MGIGDAAYQVLCTHWCRSEGKLEQDKSFRQLEKQTEESDSFLIVLFLTPCASALIKPQWSLKGRSQKHA